MNHFEPQALKIRKVTNYVVNIADQVMLHQATLNFAIRSVPLSYYREHYRNLYIWLVLFIPFIIQCWIYKYHKNSYFYSYNFYFSCYFVVTLMQSHVAALYEGTATLLRQLPPWSAIERSQPAAWTTNLNILVASRVKAFPKRPTNTGSTIHKVVHLEGGIIWCQQFLLLALGKCSSIFRLATNPSRFCLVYLLTTTSIPDPIQPTIEITIYINALAH